MKRPLNASFLLVSLILTAGGGCSASSTSNASGPDASESLGSGTCTFTDRPIGLNDSTPLGVTAAQLLAYVSGTRFATLTWGTSPDPSVTVYPTGTTTLTIDVTAMDGAITYSQADGGLCGRGTLTIPATVHFVTADGGFNETWQESLSSFDGQSLTFSHDLQRTPPTGTFRVTSTANHTSVSTETTLTATFSEQGARGDVQYVTSMMFSTGPNSGGGGGLIIHAASWVPAVGDAGAESGTSDGGDAGSDAAGLD